MPTERQQKKGKDKWREKTWFSILTPAYLGEKDIATSPGLAPENMIGRKIEMPVSDLTENFRKSNVKVVFKVDNCQGNRCFTSFVGHYMNNDSIRRMVRRRKERIDIIRSEYTLDGYGITVKVVGVSDTKLTSGKRADIRLAMDKYLSERISKTKLQDLVGYLIGDEIGSDLAKTAKQIYAMKKVEVRKSEVFGYREPQPQVEETVTEPEATETPAQ